jgi:anaerobic selenocysteine-containing dehydrogenase
MEIVRVTCAHDCPDMCSLRVHVEKNRVVRVEGDPDQPFTAGFACGKVNRDADLVNSDERLLHPLRRTGPKGSGAFERISWDEALATIAERWKAIIHESGPTAILGYAYSAHQGQFNRGLLNGFFHALGTSRLQAGTVCDTCCETAWDMTVGPVGGPDPETVSDADLIVSWGADLAATNVHFWAKVEKARKNGVELIVIDPRRHKAAASADWHLPIKIATDGALALGVMHIMDRDQLCDTDYVSQNVLGFDALKERVLPRFTPSYVSQVTGLTMEDVERLGAKFGASRRTFIRLGEGMTRSVQGGQALRAVASIPGLNGSYGRRGGGAFLLAANGFALNYGAIRKPSGPATTRLVNHLRLGEALLNMADPQIKALFIAANNPAVTCPEASKVRRGLARDDLFTVVHDPFMSATARFADIILPAALYLETQDFYRSYGSYYMQYAPAAVSPAGEARSNLEVAQSLAALMGLNDAVFRMQPKELMAALFEGSSGAVAGYSADRVMQSGPIKIEQPDAQLFGTPSGKLEIYSQTLADSGVNPLPDWNVEVQEGEGKWPLRLLTAPGYFQPHTAFSGVPFLRRREGAPYCILHPQEAGARQLVEGQTVRLSNQRGKIRLVLKISDEVQPGVVLVPGQRPDIDDDAGTINMLCSDRFTDIGEGATYQSTWLEVEAT